MRRNEGSTLARTSSLPFASASRGSFAPSTTVLTLPQRTAYSSPTLQPAPPSRSRDRRGVTGRRNLVPPLAPAVDAPAIALSRTGTLITPPRVVGSFVRSIATPQPGFGRRTLSSPALSECATQLERARPHSSLGFEPTKIDLHGHEWCRTTEEPRTPPRERSVQSDRGDPGYTIELEVDSAGLPTRRLCISQRSSPGADWPPRDAHAKALRPSPLSERSANRIFDPSPHRHAHIQHRQASMRKLLGMDELRTSACLVPPRALSPTVLVQLRPLEASMSSAVHLQRQFGTPGC